MAGCNDNSGQGPVFNSPQIWHHQDSQKTDKEVPKICVEIDKYLFSSKGTYQLQLMSTGALLLTP